MQDFLNIQNNALSLNLKLNAKTENCFYSDVKTFTLLLESEIIVTFLRFLFPSIISKVVMIA